MFNKFLRARMQLYIYILNTIGFGLYILYMICAFQDNQSMLCYFGLKLSLKIWKQLTLDFLAETCQSNVLNNR